MARIEIELGQGWSKNLQIAFEDKVSSAAMSARPAGLLALKQVHGAQICEVDETHLQKQGDDLQIVGEGDGLIARGEAFRRSGRKLLIRTADCVPLIYVDAKSEVVVALHAGWRGLLQGIHRLPFEKRWMDPLTTWAWIGPSLNGDNFDVRADMWSQFAEASDLQIFERTNDEQIRHFYPWRLIERDLAALKVELVYNVETNTLANEEWASFRRATRAGLAKSPDFNWSWVGFRR